MHVKDSTLAIPDRQTLQGRALGHMAEPLVTTKTGTLTTNTKYGISKL